MQIPPIHIALIKRLYAEPCRVVTKETPGLVCNYLGLIQAEGVIHIIHTKSGRSVHTGAELFEVAWVWFHLATEIEWDCGEWGEQVTEGSSRHIEITDVITRCTHEARGEAERPHLKRLLTNGRNHHARNRDIHADHSEKLAEWNRKQSTILGVEQ